MSDISNNLIESFCLFSLYIRLSTKESTIFNLKYFLFESSGLSILIALSEAAFTNGELTTS